jgi:hypothetical protein
MLCQSRQRLRAILRIPMAYSVIKSERQITRTRGGRFFLAFTLFLGSALEILLPVPLLLFLSLGKRKSFLKLRLRRELLGPLRSVLN